MKNTTQTLEQIELIKKRATSRKEEAEQEVSDGYNRLAERIASLNIDHTFLAKATAAIAEAEGKVKAYRIVAQYIDQLAIANIVANEMLKGADDTWSGRTNDAARSHFEGMRNAFSAVASLAE